MTLRAWGLRVRIGCAGLLLALNAPAWAGLGQGWSWDGEATTMFMAPDVREDSLYNPGNLLGSVAGLYNDSSLRLNVRWRSEDWLVAASPRLTYTRSFDDPHGRDHLVHKDAYLQKWRLERRLGPVDVYYNREDMMWGTSLLASPSNPFFANQDRTNTLVEMPTRDFLGARFHWGDEDSLNLVANVGQGRDTELLRPFKPIYAVQYEHVGQQTQWGAIASWRDKRWRLGGWGHVLTGSDSLLYVDVAWMQEPERLSPQATPWLGWQLGPRDRPDRRYLDALAGAALSLGPATTLNLEYRYNGAAYNRDERRDMDAFALSNAARMLFVDPVGGGLELAKAVQPNRSPWARQMASLYVSQALGLNTHAFGLIQYDLENKDRALTLIVEQALGSRTRLVFNGTVYGGGDRQTFQRYVNHVLIAGLRVSF